MTEETTNIVASSLWVVFADNHEVSTADGRLVDIGSFRGASAFLDEYLTGPNSSLLCGDEYRFSLGTNWISERVDLTSVYRMIFRRIKALAGDWEYHFPRLHVIDLSPLRKSLEQPEAYSPSEAFGQEQEDRDRQAELEQSRAELEAMHQRSCREAMDRPPPAIVQAYQGVYLRDPKVGRLTDTNAIGPKQTNIMSGYASTHLNLLKSMKSRRLATKENMRQNLFQRAAVLRQLKEVVPLSQAAQLELDAEMTSVPTLDSMAVLRYLGFRSSRMITNSKSAYRKMFPGHLIVYNAQVFTRSGKVLHHGDLDLTLDAARLAAAARCIGEPLYVLREGEQPGQVSELPERAVWFTGLAEVTLSLAEITRIYDRGGSPAILAKECQELEALLRAQLSVHCHVTGSWVTARNAAIIVSYSGPALSESEVTRMAHGVERVMEPD